MDTECARRGTRDRVRSNGRDDFEAVVRIRKPQSSGDGSLLVVGRPTPARTLLGEDLVDELRLMIMPVILGGGNNLTRDREWISERRHAASNPRRRREATRSVVDRRQRRRRSRRASGARSLSRVRS
ncbi:dihydrofolate reductase family protein [Streptomyces sp. NPDC057543]|uniref:dihydrofolate reductase family protein n=1 Tax=Streptomyces sp. NPDC057543 TaxID=3346163 RepID=UPI0036B4906A